MQGISKKEIEIVAWLEFYKKYFFSASDIESFVKNKTQRYNIIKSLLKKERIVKINRMKYYLIPIKAKSGKWTEHPFIVADEIFDGSGYFIGNWSAANYWRLTDQIPVTTEIYTTKRQGKIEVMNMKFIFHRTTDERIKSEAIKEKIGEHQFMIQNREESKRWIKSRD